MYATAVQYDRAMNGHVYLLHDCYFACIDSLELLGREAPMRRPTAFINIGLRAPFEVEFAGGGRHRLRAVLYAPFCPRTSLRAQEAGVLSFDFGARMRHYGTRLRQVLKGADYLELPLSLFDGLAQELDAASRGTLDVSRAGALFEQVLAAAVGPADPPECLDTRVARVLAQLETQGALQTPPTLPALAAQVHLSESRLMHLFRESVGMPLRSYLQMLKLLRLIRIWRDDATITQLAEEAGFHDAAHLSHVFSRMLGLPPTAYKDPRRFHIHRCA